MIVWSYTFCQRCFVWSLIIVLAVMETVTNHTDQPHCFQFGHNAREHRMQPLSSPTLQETIYFFGGWSNPQFMMYHNLWIERAKGTSEDIQKKWNLDRWNGHFHGHTSARHYLLANLKLFCHRIVMWQNYLRLSIWQFNLVVLISLKALCDPK